MKVVWLCQRKPARGCSRSMDMGETRMEKSYCDAVWKEEHEHSLRLGFQQALGMNSCQNFSHSIRTSDGALANEGMDLDDD